MEVEFIAEDPRARARPRLDTILSRGEDQLVVGCAFCTGAGVQVLMRSHGLMQAIARVNRVFKDKPGGLVVDYLGLAQELKEALAVYTESGGTGETAIDQEEAVIAMRMHYERCCDFSHGFAWSTWTGRRVTAPGLQRQSPFGRP